MANYQMIECPYCGCTPHEGFDCIGHKDTDDETIKDCYLCPKCNRQSIRHYKFYQWEDRNEKQLGDRIFGMKTITKKDMREFMEIVFPKGYRMSHTFDIYTDLIAVFDDNVVYTIDDMVNLFRGKDYSTTPLAQETHTYAELAGKVYKEFVFAGDKRVKYADYLYAMFSVVCDMKNGYKDRRKLHESLYTYLDKFGHEKRGE